MPHKLTRFDILVGSLIIVNPAVVAITLYHSSSAALAVVIIAWIVPACHSYDPGRRGRRWVNSLNNSKRAGVLSVTIGLSVNVVAVILALRSDYFYAARSDSIFDVVGFVVWLFILRFIATAGILLAVRPFLIVVNRGRSREV